MRDPKRIPTILAMIYRAWSRQPDARLGQLLLNLCRNEPCWPDIFNVEDDKLMGLLEYANTIDRMAEEIDREVVKMMFDPNRVEHIPPK